jgi:signal transduction histidine kinase
MVVQAEAGEAVLADSPERSATFLRAVQRSGREALTELERTVQTLRSGERTRPGLDAVPDLVATARAAGLPVAVAVEPVMRRLPAAVEESAYQVVREALTNAVRHSDHAGALVRIACHADRLEVSVLDTGTAVDRRLPGGHGLRGLREVVLARGGTLTVGPTDHGQYLVHVDLPLE